MPLNRRSIQLLSSTSTTMNETSQEVKGDSWYGYADGLHTIQLVYAAFAGRLHIQASLLLTPGVNDWFDILPISTGTVFTSANGEVYADFVLGSGEITGSEAYTFQGNYTWVRVFMDREHIGNGTTYDNSYGSIIKAILSA